MKDENVANSFVPDGSSGGSGTVYIRINIPELKVQKCLQFQLADSVWQAKQRILATFAKDLKDGLNYGLYCPPSNGRAGKFLDEERFLHEYPLQGPIGFLEFKYKRRVYKLLQINQRKIKQLHTKANLKQFLDYVRSGQDDKITKYTAKGLDPNYHDPESGETPLTVSATLEKVKARNVVVALVSGGAHLDFRNRLGLTPLHKASIRGNVEALKTMLDLGAAPNYKDGRGLTPLYYSVANDTDPRCSEMLLHERAIIGTPDEQGWYEIHHACRHGRVQHLELLIFYGADMDVQNATGNTPLHVCALNNQESCARVLLFRGASKEIFNYSNQVPYQVAIIGGNFDLAEIIKHHKQEDIVPFREVPSYSSRRKNSSVTPSMRAVMRCRSDPRLNILTWDKGAPDLSSHDDSQSNLSWKGYNSDSPRMSISSSSSSGPGYFSLVNSLRVVSPKVQYDYPRRRLYAALPGRIFVCVKKYTPTHPAELKLQRGEIIEAGSVGDIGDTVAVHRNTLAALVEAKGDGPRTMVLQKGRDGFGFVLRGAKSKHVPVSSLDFHPTVEYPALQYLDSVDQGSMADKAGLKSGDFILEINGQNVVQASHERVVELIKASGDTLQLRVVTVRPTEKNNWFVHHDGCMTLPSRGKARAPQPPKRDPNTALSYSKARSKSFAEGLAEIEKLDQTLAQYDSGGSRSKSSSMTGLDKVGAIDTDPKVASIRARHAAKRVSCVHLDGEYMDLPGQESNKQRSTPPIPPKKYASPSELRIQRYHKKYQQGTLEKARSTPNLVDGESGKEVIYATPNLTAGTGALVMDASGNTQFSSNGYKTVLSIGSGDSDSSTSSDSITGVSRGSPRQNIYSVPHMAPRVTSLRAASHNVNAASVQQGVTTGTNIRQQGAVPDRQKKPGQSSSGVIIPPPPRKPAPHPPVKSEVVQINTSSTIYANVSADVQARKTQPAESPYESSFRPGANAKVTKEPDVVTASVEQSKLKKHHRNGSMGSLQYAQSMHAMSTEDKQRFGSFPRHGHSALEIAKTSPSTEGPRSVSFADDKVFENAANFIEQHPNASLLVTSNMKSAEKRRLSKEVYEPEPDYDADSDEGEATVPVATSLRSGLSTTSRRSSTSSASSASNRSDIPVHIHTQTRPAGGTTSGREERTSVTVISVGNDLPKSDPAPLHTEEQPHYSISSTIPRRGSGDIITTTQSYSSAKPSDHTDQGSHAEHSDDVSSSGNTLRNQIRKAAMVRDRRREEQYNEIVKDSVSAAPPAPPPPPPPAAPPPPPIPTDITTSKNVNQAPVTIMPSALEIQSAVAERQTRIQNGGGELTINRPSGEDTLRKKPIDQTQAAILAAVAKRRSVLDRESENSIVDQIESRLNKTKKLQSAKFYGSSSTLQKQSNVKPTVTATPPKTADKPSPVTTELVKTAPKPSPSSSKQTTVIASRANRADNTIVTRKNDNQTIKTETTKPANGTSDFLAQAEKARQQYLQKKNADSSPKGMKQTDNSIKSGQSGVVKASPTLPLIKSQNHNKALIIEKSSGKTNPSEEISHANGSISKDDNLSIREKIKSFEKKLDLSAALKGKSAYEVRGVTMDHSHTEGDFPKANGHVSNNFLYKDDLPPPMMAPPPAFSDSSEPPDSDDLVQIEIIPPPVSFGGDEQAGSPDHCNSAFGHDDSVSLHSSVSTLSTLSSEHGDVSSDRVSYSGRQITTLDEVIAPPPPGFDDNVNHFNDNYDDMHTNNFIPPPPEFQGGNNEKNLNMRLLNKPFNSKTVDRWSCVDVLDWLESLSMLQYKSSFARQCIDGKRLVSLNRNDYIELGVMQVGHRMNIERSIKKLALQNTV